MQLTGLVDKLSSLIEANRPPNEIKGCLASLREHAEAVELELMQVRGTKGLDKKRRSGLDEAILKALYRGDDWDYYDAQANRIDIQALVPNLGLSLGKLRAHLEDLLNAKLAFGGADRWHLTVDGIHYLDRHDLV
jgi:hypothetical protein